VQARWSKELNENLHAFFENLGARIVTSCEKENAMSERPAWAKYAARDEKWMIDFKLQDFIEEHCRNVNIETCTIQAVLDVLETKFGPLTQRFKNRTKNIIAKIVNNLEEERRRASKKKEATDSGGSSKRPRTAAVGDTDLHTPEDAAWAAEVLAPLGLRPGSNEPVVKPPVAVLALILASLKTLVPTKELLRSTHLGIIVNYYRQHSSQEISSAAKELVISWKSMCLSKNKSN